MGRRVDRRRLRAGWDAWVLRVFHVLFQAKELCEEKVERLAKMRIEHARLLQSLRRLERERDGLSLKLRAEQGRVALAEETVQSLEGRCSHLSRAVHEAKFESEEAESNALLLQKILAESRSGKLFRTPAGSGSRIDELLQEHFGTRRRRGGAGPGGRGEPAKLGTVGHFTVGTPAPRPKRALVRDLAVPRAEREQQRWHPQAGGGFAGHSATRAARSQARAARTSLRDLGC